VLHHGEKPRTFPSLIKMLQDEFISFTPVTCQRWKGAFGPLSSAAHFRWFLHFALWCMCVVQRTTQMWTKRRQSIMRGFRTPNPNCRTAHHMVCRSQLASCLLVVYDIFLVYACMHVCMYVWMVCVCIVQHKREYRWVLRRSVAAHRSLRLCRGVSGRRRRALHRIFPMVCICICSSYLTLLHLAVCFDDAYVSPPLFAVCMAVGTFPPAFDPSANGGAGSATQLPFGTNTTALLDAATANTTALGGTTHSLPVPSFHHQHAMAASNYQPIFRFPLGASPTAHHPHAHSPHTASPTYPHAHSNTTAVNSTAAAASASAAPKVGAAAASVYGSIQGFGVAPAHAQALTPTAATAVGAGPEGMPELRSDASAAATQGEQRPKTPPAAASAYSGTVNPSYFQPTSLSAALSPPPK
jgi:hypothetical protein